MVLWAYLLANKDDNPMLIHCLFLNIYANLIILFQFQKDFHILQEISLHYYKLQKLFFAFI